MDSVTLWSLHVVHTCTRAPALTHANMCSNIVHPPTHGRNNEVYIITVLVLYLISDLLSLYIGVVITLILWMKNKTSLMLKDLSQEPRRWFGPKSDFMQI